MRRIMSVSLLVGVLLVAATSRSDIRVINVRPGATPIEEPITGTSMSPDPKEATTVSPKGPFSVDDAGAANEGTWSYRDLSEAERVLADRGRTANDWTEINSEFGSASSEQGKRAAASAAASQLGIAGVGEIGVVP
jgi:hypothetical protein